MTYCRRVDDDGGAEFTALLVTVPAMTLATAADGLPWAADVYFCVAGDALVFLSSPTSRHCRNLGANASCAVTVHSSDSSWREIRGLQMEGTAAPVHGQDDLRQAWDTYFAKFPFARELAAPALAAAGSDRAVRPYLFRPEVILGIDNATGFGSRRPLRLEDGRLLSVRPSG